MQERIETIKEMQEKIIHSGQGQNDLKIALGNQENFLVNEFIVTENLSYKIGTSKNANPKRMLAAEILLDFVKRTYGETFVSVAIRGDNLCSHRSLMAGTLIAARRLLYQGQKEIAYTLLNDLEKFADELYKRINEPQFKDLNSFTKNYHPIKQLLQDIRQEKTTVTELVLLSNSDFSVKYSPQDPFNLSLSCLSAFIMDKKLEEQAKEIGLTKEELSNEGYKYDVLQPGSSPTTSSDRVAFLSALNILNRGPTLRIESVVATIELHNIKTLNDANTNKTRFSPEIIENDAGKIEIITCNMGGHTNLLLNKTDMEFIQQELTIYRQKNKISDQALQVYNQLSDIMLLISDTANYKADNDLLNSLMTTTKQERYTVLSTGKSIASLISLSKNDALIKKLSELDGTANVNLQKQDYKLAQELNGKQNPSNHANNQHGMFGKKSSNSDDGKKIEPDSTCTIS